MNTDLLKQKAGILEYHFCIHIDKHGNLSKLPVILDQYTPDMDRIPEFVLSLGNDVSDAFMLSMLFSSCFFLIFDFYCDLYDWLLRNGMLVFNQHKTLNTRLGHDADRCFVT